MLLINTRNEAGPSSESDNNFASVSDASSSEGRAIPSYSNPVVRKLLNETQGIFHKLQNWAEVNDQLGAEELSRASCEYRSSLRSVCISLQELEDSPQATHLLQLYRSSEIIWSLAEILFVRPPGSSVSLDLIDWACWNFTRADEWAADILASEESTPPEDHPQFWQTIYLYTLLGRCGEGVRLLQTHSRKMEMGFRSVEELMRKIPLEFLGVGENAEWNHWLTEARRRLREGHFTPYPQLDILARILCGDESVLMELRSLIPNWFEALIPLVLYKHSDIKILEVQEVVQEALTISGQNRSGVSSSPLDAIILALIELDILKGLRELSAQSTDWWFPAHLADLLYHAGCKDLRMDSHGLYARKNLSKSLIMEKSAERSHDDTLLLDSSETLTLADGSVSLREYLVLEYAQSLMVHPSLWEIGVAYLDACPRKGGLTLRSCLETLVDSDFKAMKVLRLADERGMGDLKGGICLDRGLRALQQKNPNLRVALEWCLRSKDGDFASCVAENCFEEYQRTGKLHGLNLMDEAGDADWFSPQLIFLAKYNKFHELYREGRLKEAGDVLCQLVKSRVAPRQFWVTLLLDALPMLDRDDIHIFDKEQTYELLEMAETIATERDIIKSGLFAKTDVERESLDGQMKHFRMGLVRNLAKAIVH